MTHALTDSPAPTHTADPSPRIAARKRDNRFCTSLWVAIALFVWTNLRAAVIGPSAAWHAFAGWSIA